MYYTNKITKGFLTGGGQWLPSPSRPEKFDEEISRWQDYEDPTYMGFYFRIIPDGYYDPTNMDMDVMPMGLFMKYDENYNKANDTEKGLGDGYTNLPDGAESFLRRRGEYYRAGMIREFREGFMKVSTYEPWTFEKVEGLADLWRVDPKNPYRAKEKKIIFDCHESISMKMTYLIDCYRKASYDFSNMRHMLPDNQRYFSMDLWVTEIRHIKRPNTAADPKGLSPNSFFNTGSFIRFRLDYCEFDFLTEETVGYLADVARYASDKPAHVKIPIKIGAIREVNNYGMMGGLIADTFYNYQRGKDTMYSSFNKTTSIQGEPEGDGVTRGDDVEKFSRDLQTLSYNNVDGFKDLRSLLFSAATPPFFTAGETEWREGQSVGKRTEDKQFSFGVGNKNNGTENKAPGKQGFESKVYNAQGELVDRVNTSLNAQNIQLGGAPAQETNLAGENALGENLLVPPSGTLIERNLGSVDVGSRARALAGNLLRGAFLGNVYGLSLTTLVGELQGILNNPVAALQGLLSKFAKSPKEASTMADNINLDGADIELLKGFIGDIKEIQSVTAGTSLENATLGELVRLEPPKATTPNPRKEDLLSSGKTSLLQSDLGRILFGSSPVAAQAVAKAQLEGPVSTIDASLDTSIVTLEGDKIDSDSTPKPANVNLESQGSSLKSTGLGNIGFSNKSRK